MENLLVGCGADEVLVDNIYGDMFCLIKLQLIDLLLRVVLEPGDKIINTPPTFGMYSFDCHINGAYLRMADFSR